MLKVRSDEIEADFQRYYGIHLGDLFTGELSIRRFAVLFWALPPGCTTWRFQGGDLTWSTETVAMLNVARAVEQFQQSFADKPKKVPMPQPPEWGHLEKEAGNIETTERRMKRFLSRVGPEKD